MLKGIIRKAGIARDYLNSDVSIGFLTRVRMLRLGFMSEKYLLYNLKENDYRDYFSDYRRSRARFINEPYSIVLNNKILFAEVFAKYIQVPENYGWIRKGSIFPLDNNVAIEEVSNILELLSKGPGLVIKPVVGGGGKCVYILKSHDHQLMLNNKQVTPDYLRSFISSLDDYIISRFVVQGEYSRGLFPLSTNTMRILTMIDPESHKAFIPMAVQRIGNRTSAPVDNFSSGGLSAIINLDTGELSAGISRESAKKQQKHEVHPDNGSKIEGARVPGWTDIKTKLLSTAERLPYLKYIGWDIVVTDDGITAIEANNYPDPDVLQIHKPLLKDERVSRFYRHYGLL